MRLARFGGGLILGIWAYVLSRQPSSVSTTFLMFTLIGLASDAWITVLKELIGHSVRGSGTAPQESVTIAVHGTLLYVGLALGCVALGAFGMRQTLEFLTGHATGSGGVDGVGWLFWLLAIGILFGAPICAAYFAAASVGRFHGIVDREVASRPIYGAASLIVGAAALAYTGYLVWNAALTTIPTWPPPR